MLAGALAMEPAPPTIIQLMYIQPEQQDSVCMLPMSPASRLPEHHYTNYAITPCNTVNDTICGVVFSDNNSNQVMDSTDAPDADIGSAY